MGCSASAPDIEPQNMSGSAVSSRRRAHKRDETKVTKLSTTIASRNSISNSEFLIETARTDEEAGDEPLPMFDMEQTTSIEIFAAKTAFADVDTKLEQSNDLQPPPHGQTVQEFAEQQQQDLSP